ncbi:dienelactone hydrolase family protein [Candidatus Poribacteria bacterium]|nr:dienelactone hydrolase family protein [Candidatus Poribacteria bacterium]
MIRRLLSFALACALVLVAACVRAAGEEPTPVPKTPAAPPAAEAPRTPEVVPVKGENVTYSSRLGEHRAFLARPDGEGPFPGLIVIHEWWGLNDGIREEARKLAELGYAALAVDLYGGQVATEAPQARALKDAVKDDDALETMRAAVQYLSNQSFTKDRAIGCIGWCFGGRKSLQLAIAEPRIRACVIYYGTPVTEVETLRQIRGSVLGIFGEADQAIPMTEVETLKKGLDEAGIRSEFHTYPGAGHAFANPSNKAGYNTDAAADARKWTAKFLLENLGSGMME